MHTFLGHDLVVKFGIRRWPYLLKWPMELEPELLEPVDPILVLSGGDLTWPPICIWRLIGPVWVW